jgi:hypothetical protein
VNVSLFSREKGSAVAQPRGLVLGRQFAVVLETAPLNEAELAEYCRRKGLYPEQIAAWREACRSANANANAGEQARAAASVKG